MWEIKTVDILKSLQSHFVEKTYKIHLVAYNSHEVIISELWCLPKCTKRKLAMSFRL